MSDIKEHIDLEINGQKMHPETYEVVKFRNGDIKIVAIYFDQEGFKEESE